MNDVRKIDRTFLNSMTAQALESPRKRAHYSLHENNDAAFHRLVVASEPGTRVRPHRHSSGGKWELLIGISGRCDILIFDQAGVVLDRIELSPNGENSAVEMASGVWHGFVAMEPGSAFIEVKPGPYAKPDASDWAPWAPDENAPEAVAFEQWCRTAKVGDRFQP